MSAWQAVLHTERLTLEPLAAAHADLVFPLLADPLLYRWIPQEAPICADFLDARFKRILARSQEAAGDRWLNWFARLSSNGDYAAMVETTLKPDGELYLAYFVFGSFQGFGYGTEACRAVLQYLAIHHGASRAMAEIDTRNEASIALVERLGFQRCGFKPAADFFKGASSDEYVYRRDLVRAEI